MDFVVPQNMPPIATYRIMNSEGVIEDESQAPEGVTNEQVVGWYKSMLTGMLLIFSIRINTNRWCSSMNILDTIMSEAQRQGRLSFYMVLT